MANTKVLQKDKLFRVRFVDANEGRDTDREMTLRQLQSLWQWREIKDDGHAEEVKALEVGQEIEAAGGRWGEVYVKRVV